MRFVGLSKMFKEAYILLDAGLLFVDSGMPDMGMALQLNGAGQVDLGNPALLDFATEDWTVSAWYKTSMTGSGDDFKGAIVAKGGDSTLYKIYAGLVDDVRIYHRALSEGEVVFLRGQ